MRAFLFSLMLLALAGCGARDPRDDQALQQIVNDTRGGNVDAAYEHLAPSLKTEQSQAGLAQLASLLEAAGEPCERSLIGMSTFRQWSTGGETGRRVTARHRYDCPNAAFVVDLRLWFAIDAPYVIENFHITTIDPAAEAQAAEFSVEGKSIRHYAFLAAAFASPVLMITALLGVIFTKGFKRKWLWGILSFVGVTKVAMIWTTGEIVTQFLTVNVIGFGITRGADPSASWVVNFTIPVGALLVLSLLWPRWAGLSAGEELAGPKQ